MKIHINNALRLRTRFRYQMDMMIHPNKTKMYCPCCGLRFRTFVEGFYKERPYQFNSDRYENIRQDVICPFCNSAPRHRILASWFDNNMSVLNTSDILYFAPENCMMLWMNRNRIKPITADLYQPADLRIDIQSTGLPDNTFGLVICNHVLEHVDDFREALREVYRILKKGASFICSFPIDPNIELLDEDLTIKTNEERILRFGQNDHKRIFGVHAERFLQEEGFIVKRISGEDYPDEILPIVGPADYDINCLFRCVK